MIIDLIKTYFPEMLVVIGVIAPLMPFIRSRVISDKNMQKVFGDVKELASKVGFKEEDINKSLLKIDQMTKYMSNRVDQFENRLESKVQELDQSIVNFMETDLFKKMLLGLQQLDTIVQIMENKDQIIEAQFTVIKEIRKKLG
jgi:division protein CdvB (Snf7/Vps24/ESCRT-III family)